MKIKQPKDYGIAVGRRFDRLLVQPYTEIRDGRLWFQCLCDCGSVLWIRAHKLAIGHTKSCGCFSRDGTIKRNTSHGLSATRAYAIWGNMIQRCTDPNSTGYEFYGAKGIRVCERWLKFQNFHADMGTPAPRMTIDRIDPRGNYEPQNCCWATAKQQAQNTTRCLKYHRHGQLLNVMQWSEIENVPAQRVYQRLKRGWSIEQALLLPAKTRLS